MQNLTYQISAKEPFIVVSFQGALSRSSAETIDKCESEIVSSQAKLVVLNMQGAAGLERPLIAALVRLQKHIRDNSKSLRICNMTPDLHKTLYEAGALRNMEIADDLKEALASLLQSAKSPAKAA